MSTHSADIADLSRGGGRARTSTVARPPSRWKTRILLPAAILLIVFGLLGYSAGNMPFTTVDVWTVAVVPRPLGSDAAVPASQGRSPGEFESMLAQAPGWIEPDPYPINVPALADGVVQEVLFLEGEAVEAGQVVARLVDSSARLAVQAVEAELDSARAELKKAQADLHAVEARAAEIGDQLQRDRELASSGAVARGVLSQQEFRFSASQQEIESARAVVGVAQAHVRRREVALDEARLLLSRMQIQSPASGIVLSRLVEPGSRLSMASRNTTAPDAMGGTVLRLYDPSKLQVRVDVPLADCAKIGVGAPAEITTEALPDRVIKGAVTRIVHEADIRRNTLQVKVAIRNPPEALKPEMLARVRFFSSPQNPEVHSASAAATGHGRHPAGVVLLVPESLLLDRQGDTARAWFVEYEKNGAGQIAVSKDLKLRGRGGGGYVDVLEGVRPGDRLIADPPASLRSGMRVRVRGEKANAGGTTREPSQ